MTSGGSISCADQIDRVSDPEWPLRAAQFLKPPALPGDTYRGPFQLHPVGVKKENGSGRLPIISRDKRFQGVVSVIFDHGNSPIGIVRGQFLQRRNV